MSLFVGARLTCDRGECRWSISAGSEKEVREHAEMDGWSQADGRRDFCPSCTKSRAERPKIADLLPGYVLLNVLDAARAAGFAVAEKEDGDAEVTCCGEPVSVESFIGCPCFAKCGKCGSAIVDAAGPSFGNASVSFMDYDKVDIDSGETWYVVGTEPDAAETRETA